MFSDALRQAFTALLNYLDPDYCVCRFTQDTSEDD
jgi:hypothetical protein